MGSPMLLFIDQPKHLRVVRSTPDGSGAVKREILGKITKATLELSPELSAAIQAEEKGEVDKAIEMFSQAQAVQKRAAALNFPQTMRIVVDYLQSEASETERKLIVGALFEGIRLIRKAAKEEAE